MPAPLLSLHSAAACPNCSSYRCTPQLPALTVPPSFCCHPCSLLHRNIVSGNVFLRPLPSPDNSGAHHPNCALLLCGRFLTVIHNVPALVVACAGFTGTVLGWQVLLRSLLAYLICCCRHISQFRHALGCQSTCVSSNKAVLPKMITMA